MQTNHVSNRQDEALPRPPGVVQPGDASEHQPREETPIFIEASLDATVGDKQFSANDSFNEQFVPKDPKSIACDDCLILLSVSNGSGAAALKKWLLAATAMLRSATGKAIYPPQGSPHEDGVIFMKCSQCELRYHATWYAAGETTRWVIGRPNGAVYQGRSSFQPDIPLALDNSRHYREHNLELLRGQQEM